MRPAAMRHPDQLLGQLVRLICRSDEEDVARVEGDRLAGQHDPPIGADVLGTDAMLALGGRRWVTLEVSDDEHLFARRARRVALVQPNFVQQAQRPARRIVRVDFKALAAHHRPDAGPQRCQGIAAEIQFRPIHSHGRPIRPQRPRVLPIGEVRIAADRSRHRTGAVAGDFDRVFRWVTRLSADITYRQSSTTVNFHGSSALGSDVGRHPHQQRRQRLAERHQEAKLPRLRGAAGGGFERRRRLPSCESGSAWPSPA